MIREAYTWLDYRLNQNIYVMELLVYGIRPGMAIGSKLLSEQPARDRAEHGALRNADRLQSVLVRVNSE